MVGNLQFVWILTSEVNQMCQETYDYHNDTFEGLKSYMHFLNKASHEVARSYVLGKGLLAHPTEGIQLRLAIYSFQTNT